MKEDEELPIFSSKIIRRIDLTPEEQRIPTWIEHEPLTKPEPEPFDRAECIKRFKSVNPGKSYWPKWQKAKIAKSLTPEEAEFWLFAKSILNNQSGTFSSKVKVLEKGEANEKLEMEEAINCVGHYYQDDDSFYPCLLALYDPKDIVVFESPYGHFHHHTGGFFRNHVLPYLNNKERKEWKEFLRPHIKLQCGNTLAIAACLGMHQEIRKFLDGLPDNQFAKDIWYADALPWIIFGLDSPEAIDSEFRRLGLNPKDQDIASGLLATAGILSVDLIGKGAAMVSSKSEAESVAKALHKVIAPEAAETAIHLIAETKAQKIGLEWIQNNPVPTAIKLPEIARGKGKLAEIAKDQLLILNASENRNALNAALPNLDEATAEWVKKEIIENETGTLKALEATQLPKALRNQFDSVKSKQKLPEWLNPSLLPPIRVNDGTLSSSEIEKLLIEFKSKGVAGDSELGKTLRELAEPTSLDAFAWKVFETWIHMGAPPKDKWTLGTIGYLGGDDCVLKLTPMIREWPGKSQHQRAVLGLDCLRQIGSETALMALNGIAQKLKYKALKEKANLRMKEIAEEQGLTAEQLADRIVPDCGLDERGSRTFDFGPRQFDFVFTSEFKPAVKDANGKVRANLPKPNKSDDPDTAEIALAEWKLLKKTLRESLKIQNSRMEEAMITGRKWEAADFQNYIIKHPLMIHLARSIVWGEYDPNSSDLKSTFRVTDENAIADSEDEDRDFPTGKQIGVVHPAHLDETTLSNWGEVLSDYEIIPPFQQLGRSIYSAEKDDLKKKEITRFKGPKIPGISLYGILERSHWLRDIPADAGGFMQHSKYFPSADVTAFIQYDPGLSIGWYEEPQTLSSVYFVPGHIKPDWWGKHKNRIKIGELDPVVLSEVLRVVHVLASKAES